MNEKARLLNAIARSYYESENDSCLAYAQKALAYAIRHGEDEQRFLARLQLAEIYRVQDNVGAAVTALSQAERALPYRCRRKHLPRLLLVKGNVACSRKDYRQAERYYRNGYSLCLSRAPHLRANFYLGFADIALERGRTKNERRYLLKAYLLARAHGNTHLAIVALNNLGVQAAQTDAYATARNYFNESLVLARRQRNVKAQSRACLNIGSLYYYEGDWRAAVAHYVNSADLKEQLNDKAGIALIHNNIATIYKEQRRYGKSLEYYRKTSAYYEQTGDSVKLAETRINEAIVQIGDGKPAEGIRLLKKALRLIGTRDHPGIVLIAHTNLAFACTELRRFERSLHYLRLAEKNTSAPDDTHTLAVIALLYGVNHYSLRHYAEASRYYERCLRLAKAAGLRNEQKKALLGLYQTAQKTGHYREALAWHEQYVSLADSLLSSAGQQQLIALEEKYDVRQKNRAIASLYARNRVFLLNNQLTSSRLQLSLASIALAVSGIAFLSGWYYRRTKRQRLLLISTRERHNEEVHQLMSEQQIELLETAVRSQQTERRKLAKDIHDNLGSYLATLKYQHEAYRPETDHPVLIAHYATTAALIAEACAEVRSISHQLVTGSDFRFRFLPALDELVRRVRTTRQFGLQFYHYPDDFSLDRDCALALYKMIQELLSNILKHAQATHVELQVTCSEEAVTVLIEDNGCGFDPDAPVSGIGFSNIRERLREFDGRLEINSGFRRGTTIVLIIPLTFDNR